MEGPEEITIFPMTEDDLEGVIAIESVSFPHPWTRSHFLDELRSPHAFPLVARHRQRGVAGYICTVVVLDEAEIRDVAVAPEMRGCGIGKILVDAALEKALGRGAGKISLEVRASNEAAISLYRRLGFTETGVRKRYYENTEDALLMEYRFPGEGREAECSSGHSS